MDNANPQVCFPETKLSTEYVSGIEFDNSAGPLQITLSGFERVNERIVTETTSLSFHIR